MKKKNGFSMAFTVAIMGVIIAISTAVVGIVASRINADNSYANTMDRSFIVNQYEYNFINLDSANFVLYIQSCGGKKTYESLEQDFYQTKDYRVVLNKDYKQLSVLLLDENNTELIYLKVDDARHVIERRTNYII